MRRPETAVPTRYLVMFVDADGNETRSWTFINPADTGDTAATLMLADIAQMKPGEHIEIGVADVDADFDGETFVPSYGPSWAT